MANNKVQLANGTVLIDITDTTANASDVLSGEYFYDASGVKTEGSLTIPSTYTITKTLTNVTTSNNDTEVLDGGSFYMDLIPSFGMVIGTITVIMGGVDVTEQVFKAGVGEKTITQNGIYDAEDDWLEGYSEVTVNVPNKYTSADEGKVVLNGALVAQTSDTVTQNGTVDTTLINSLTVNVSGGSTPTGTKQISITQNGTITEDVTDYANVEITTNVTGLPTKLLNAIEITPTTTLTNNNKMTVNLTANVRSIVAVVINNYPSAPDSSQYIALSWTKNSDNSTIINQIMRPDGTIGTDQSMCAFTKSTGKLTIGGQYGHFFAGTTYRIFQIEIG